MPKMKREWPKSVEEAVEILLADRGRF